MQKNLYLFIHGIGSDQSTWNPYISILKDDHDINIKDTYFEESDEEIQNYYNFFNYNSPIINKKTNFLWLRRKSTGSKQAGELTVSNHSDALLSFIEHEENKYNNIYILAHSMGGLITLDCIFNLINKNKSKLIKKIKKVIFFATPITGSDDSDDIKKYFDGKYFSHAVKELATDSKTIVSVKKKLNKYKSNLKKMDILFLYGSTDARIGVESRNVAEAFCKEVKTIQCNHTDIKEPKNSDSESYSYVMSFINKKVENSAPKLMNEYEKSISKLEKKWYQFKSVNPDYMSFIILESHYINTIYANATFISYLKYKIRMMEDGEVKINHKYLPFDKVVEKIIIDDEFYKNHASKRFTSKSYKINVSPQSIPLEYSKPMYCKDADGKEWVEWKFNSELIPKDTEFEIEISISDVINIDNTPEAKERREDYFSYGIDNINKPHGVRYNKYQIEIYNDTFDKNVFLPYEPWILVDGKKKKNMNNCEKNIYYKTWNWDFYYCDLDSKTIQIKLRESDSLIKEGASCN